MILLRCILLGVAVVVTIGAIREKPGKWFADVVGVRALAGVLWAVFWALGEIVAFTAGFSASRDGFNWDEYNDHLAPESVECPIEDVEELAAVTELAGRAFESWVKSVIVSGECLTVQAREDIPPGPDRERFADVVVETLRARDERVEGVDFDVSPLCAVNGGE